MLDVTIPEQTEMWDENKQEFVYNSKSQKLQLEHSLVSISKWESKWNKSYIATRDKTHDEIVDYIKCMTLNKNVDEGVYERLPNEVVQQIVDYIEAPMTATYIKPSKSKGGNIETPTSELIYYWMVALNIPFECQKWHLNRLITLINVCNVKNNPPKKMPRNEILRENAALNAARRKKLNTKG